MIKEINFYYFSFSTYLIIILISFILALIVFYKLVKSKYEKIDIIFIFVMNIIGFAVGSKIFSLIDKKQVITMENFINSGYSFIGGIIGSCILIYAYCKKNKLDYYKMQSYFAIVYPLIYSISKIGCFLNGCCKGTILNFPVQLLESVIMFGIFLILLYYHNKQHYCYTIINFVILFGIERFVIDYFRDIRNIMILNFTLSQICCFIEIIIGIKMLYNWSKKENPSNLKG